MGHSVPTTQKVLSTQGSRVSYLLTLLISNFLHNLFYFYLGKDTN